MHGNVLEWCEDWYGEYPRGSAVDPTGPSSGEYRVERGGSWQSLSRYARSADRNMHLPDTGSTHLGLRIAATIE
jgi:formylglycine-generating enzyme required for sulfatase activity